MYNKKGPKKINGDDTFIASDSLIIITIYHFDCFAMTTDDRITMSATINFYLRVPSLLFISIDGAEC